ncbi:MAG: hypothetical protein NTY42_11230 [Planctomycetota bacterium]|jgi:hypothetical protein|nr:hypothetical protein [Planctomycetota bacterium]
MSDSTAKPNPFDPANLAKLRLSQDFSELAQVKQVLTTIRCGRPPKQDFFQVRPGEENRFPACCFKDEVSGETYLVSPDIASMLGNEAKPKLLVVCMPKLTDTPFLWDLTIPSSDGRANAWHTSAMGIAKTAETRWVKLISDQASGFYKHEEPKAEHVGADWTNTPPMAELLRLAFEGRFIADSDHPVLRRLRGES